MGTHGGDGNQDGIADSLQANVASLPNAMTGEYVTIVAPPGLQLEAVTAILDPLYVTRPPGFAFPLGFFDFTVTGLCREVRLMSSCLLRTRQR